MLLWLAHRDWNLFCNPWRDCLGRRGTFLSCDFGLPRTGSFLAVQSGSLDSLHSSSGTSSFSAWALGLIWNGSKPLELSGPIIAPQNHVARLLGQRGGFWRSQAHIMVGWVLFPYGCRVPSSTNGTLLALRRARCIVINAFFFLDNANHFGIRNVYSMTHLWSSADLEVEGSLRNWTEFYFAWHPSLSFVCGEFPQILPPI